MLYLHAPGQPVHRIPSGHRTDAACYVLERKSVMACGCDGCRLSAWQMDVQWWYRVRDRVRTDAQLAAWAQRSVRLLDRAEAFVRSGKLLKLEELTIDRGIGVIAKGTGQAMMSTAAAHLAKYAAKPGVN